MTNKAAGMETYFKRWHAVNVTVTPHACETVASRYLV